MSSTAGSADDWSRDSIICNSSWHNGQIPIHSVRGYVGKDEETWEDIVKMPIRGVLGTLEILIEEKVIRVTPEVAALLRCVEI